MAPAPLYSDALALAARTRRCVASHRLRLGVAALRFYANEVQTSESRPRSTSRVERSFASDIQGSIQARIRRENERRQQYERWRELTDPGRNWTLTFRTLRFLLGDGHGYCDGGLFI